jgi:hypothetical protein
MTRVMFCGNTARTPRGAVDMVPLLRRLDGDMTAPIHEFEREAGIIALRAMGVGVEHIANAMNMSFTSVADVLAGKRNQRERRPATAVDKHTKWQQARQRRYSERVLIDGRLVYPGANHGTNSAYHSWGCRCIPCCEAHRVARHRKNTKEVSA